MYNSSMRFFKILSVGVLIVSAAPALAQQTFLPSYESEKKPEVTAEPEKAPVIAAAEPTYPPVKHVLFDWPEGLLARIESLPHGVTMDLPPAYDHYGYEIRRYMVSVGSIKVMSSTESLKGQIRNIENAQVLLKAWNEDINTRFKQIEKQIETENADPTTRSKYKYTRGLVVAALSEIDAWLRNNKSLLGFLLILGPENYNVKEGRFYFRTDKDYKKFESLYDARERALTQIHKYTPFTLMIY
jgi:hypothetical protein